MKALAIVIALGLAACGAPEAQQGSELPAQYDGHDCNVVTLGLSATNVGDTNATIRCQVDSTGRYYWLVVPQNVVGN